MDKSFFSSAAKTRSATRRPPFPAPRRRSLTRGFFSWLSGLIRFLLATALFFTLMSGGSYLLVSHFLLVKAEFMAPKLVGKPISEAIKWLGTDKKLRDYNLSVKCFGDQPSETIEKDCIISQYPEENHPIKKGTAIRVVISSGIALIPMPDLRGMPQNRAGFMLRKAGLEVGYRTQLPSTTDPVGTVLETDPPAGTGVPQDSKVSLLVATGQTRVSQAMPNLTGMKLDQAREVLTQAGLFATEVKDTSAGAPPDQVIGQSPQVGDSVSDSTHIVIKYAPPRQEAVPDDAAPASDNGSTSSSVTEIKPGDLGEVPAVALPPGAPGDASAPGRSPAPAGAPETAPESAPAATPAVPPLTAGN